MNQVTLTARERQLVECIRRALPNKIIAYELGLSEGTIKQYLYLLFRKVGVGSRLALLSWSCDAAEWQRQGPVALARLERHR